LHWVPAGLLLPIPRPLSAMPAGAERELQSYVFLVDSGDIKQRATLCTPWSPGDAEGQHVSTMRNLSARELGSPSCVKVFLDGVPTDSHTAAICSRTLKRCGIATTKPRHRR
jgi:hypothetical protein